MGKYKNKAYSLRIEEEIMLKLTQIAEVNSRTKNKEIEFALKQYVKQYENDNGTINIKTVNMRDNNGIMHF